MKTVKQPTAWRVGVTAVALPIGLTSVTAVFVGERRLASAYAIPSFVKDKSWKSRATNDHYSLPY